MRTGVLGAVAILLACVACERALTSGPVNGGTTGPAGAGEAGGPGGAGGGGSGGSPDPVPAVCSSIATSVGAFNPCGHAFGFAYSPDGRLVAMGKDSLSPNVHLWRLSDGRRVLDIDGIGSGTYDVAFSPDGQTLVTAGRNEVVPQLVKLWDVTTGALLRTLPVTCGSYADTVAFSGDGALLATAGEIGPIEIWRVADGTRVTSIPYPTSVHNVRFSPDSAQIIAAGVDGRATVWNVPAGTPALTLNGIADEMADAAFSPEGAQIATTGPNNDIELWDAATGTLLQTLPGHTSIVSHVVWVGSDRLITNDWGGTIISWTRGSGGFASTGSWSTEGQSLGIALSPDGKTFGTGGMQAGIEGFFFLSL